MDPLNYQYYFAQRPNQYSFFRKHAYTILTGSVVVGLIGLTLLQGSPSNAEAPQLNAEQILALKEQEEPSYQLIEPTLVTNSGFSKGSCPTSTNKITGATLLSPINKEASVGDYVPPNLVEIHGKIPTLGGKEVCLEETTAFYLKQLFGAAERDGIKLLVMSGYRSPHYQLDLYNDAIEEKGYVGTLRVAPPYHSEHHINAVDFTTDEIMASGGDLSATLEGRWLIKNAPTYGFVMSYPKGKEEITGYQHEDWHWKFIGIENAQLVQSTGLTFHELATNPTTKIITKSETSKEYVSDEQIGEVEIGG
ncbi:MAG TPA: M15 family metallopeptidase [Candidatus Paceibacterota bacterium]